MKTQIDTDKFTKFINEQGINQRTRKDYNKFSRYVCFKFLRDCGYTLAKIGSYFDKSTKNGIMDHSTVLNGLRRYDELLPYLDFQDIIEDVEPVLRSFIIEKPETVTDQFNGIELTWIESDLLKCESYLDFLKLKNKLINELKILK